MLKKIFEDMRERSRWRMKGKQEGCAGMEHLALSSLAFRLLYSTGCLGAASEGTVGYNTPLGMLINSNDVTTRVFSIDVGGNLHVTITNCMAYIEPTNICRSLSSPPLLWSDGYRIVAQFQHSVLEKA